MKNINIDANLKLPLNFMKKPTKGDAIRFYRRLRGHSPKELAKKVGISNSLLRSIENGNRIPSDKIIVNIAASLDIKVANISRLEKIKIDYNIKNQFAELTQKELEKYFKVFLNNSPAPIKKVNQQTVI